MVDVPLSAGKSTIDVSDYNSLKALHSSLYRLSSFSRSFTTSSIVAISLLGSVLEVIKNLRPFQLKVSMYLFY